ncbi:20687_t:CDS:1, partial [Gigaspora margarita]
MCTDINFQYWIVTPTEQWDTLEYHKACYKTLKQQLFWYEINSLDKEKAKAKEILEGLS